jgi:hypothetical protein
MQDGMIIHVTGNEENIKILGMQILFCCVPIFLFSLSVNVCNSWHLK